MEKSGRKKLCNYSLFRRRGQTNDIWINRMVYRRMEKHISKLNLDYYRYSKTLFQVIKNLKGLVDCLQSQLERKGQEQKRKTEEDEVDAIWLDIEKLMCKFSDTYGEETDDADSSDTDSSDTDNSDADTSSQPAKCEQQKNQWISPEVITVADICQAVKELEEEIFHANPSMMGPETCEKGDVQAEEALLMETQWLEQMHKQKVKPADQQNTEEQGGEAQPVPEKQMKQRERSGDCEENEEIAQ